MVFNMRISYKVKKGAKPSGAFKREITQWQDETQLMLSAEPGPPHYPIRWTTPKQRRYVFGFVLKRDSEGRIIPTKRTGRVREWSVFVDYDAIDRMQKFVFQLGIFAATIDPKNKSAKLGRAPGNGILVEIKNPADFQSYVTGTSQQGFHVDTGWIHAPTVINVQRRKLDGIMQDTGMV